MWNDLIQGAGLLMMGLGSLAVLLLILFVRDWIVTFKNVPGKYRVVNNPKSTCKGCAFKNSKEVSCFRETEINCTPGDKLNGIKLKTPVIFERLDHEDDDA